VAAKTLPNTLRQPGSRDLLYYLLLILSFFHIFDFILRSTIGGLPVVGSVVPAWKEGLILLLYIAYYMKSKAEGRVDWKATRLHKLILLTFLASVASVIWNYIANPMTLVIEPSYHWVPVEMTPGIAADGIRTLLEATLYFLVLNALIDDEETISAMIHAMIIAATAVALFGVYQKLAGWETPKEWVYSEHENNIKIRVFSSVGNPNSLGAYMVLIAPIAISLTLWAKTWGRRLMYGSASLIMILCLVLTFSRGAWLGFLAGMAMYALVTRNKWLGLIGLAGLAAAPFVAPNIVERLTFAFTPEYLNKSADQGRVEFWKRAFLIWKESPVFGTGIGLVGDSVGTRNNVPGATWIDNQYIRVLAEMGLVGLISYVMMLFAPVIAGFRAVFGSKQKNTFLYAVNAGIVAALFGQLVENVTAGLFENLNVITTFWTLVALLYVGIRLASRKANA